MRSRAPKYCTISGSWNESHPGMISRKRREKKVVPVRPSEVMMMEGFSIIQPGSCVGLGGSISFGRLQGRGDVAFGQVQAVEQGCEQVEGKQRIFVHHQ